MCRALRLCAAILSEPVRKKLDTKDDILIIASEQERVKMNVYEWLESSDVREYLESVHYEFTLPEAFYVIRENEQRALEEKIAAWEECLTLCRTVLFR